MRRKQARSSRLKRQLLQLDRRIDFYGVLFLNRTLIISEHDNNHVGIGKEKINDDLDQRCVFDTYLLMCIDLSHTSKSRPCRM
jgi:hypothetical protein